jgi:ABC-type antimicrobial peptide transport system permease subunit
MTPLRLLLRNLLYHWRGNLAVLLGVVVGAAVLTGALLVGDSLRGSLRDLTLQRLGWVDEALVTGRFFREAASIEPLLTAPSVSDAIVLRGTASVPEDERHVRNVSIYGVPSSFWPDGPRQKQWPENIDRRISRSLDEPNFPYFPDEVDSEGHIKAVLNRALADDLKVKPGQTATLRVTKASVVPRETLLGRRDDSAVVDDLKVVVTDVLSDDEFGARFSLQPAAETPRNAFVPLHALQVKIGQEGRVNAIFVGGASPEQLRRFQQKLDLDDWGLELRDPKSRTQALFDKFDKDHDGKLTGREWVQKRGDERRALFADAIAKAIPHPTATDVLERAEVEEYFRTHANYISLESRQLLIEPAVEEAALAAAKDAKLRAAPTLVYLADTLAHGKEEAPYVVVAALDPEAPPPLGPFLPEGVKHLKDDEIVLAEWEGSPIHAKPGDPITIKYYPPEQHGEFKLAEATFKLAGTIPLAGPAADPGLTPEFPGVTDKASIDDWDPPFPFDDKRIKPADEKFWDDYRAAPRAYVNLAAGQKLWGSRFGRVTSIRLAPKDGTDLDATEKAFKEALKDRLDPERGGFVFQDLKKQGLEASGGSADFAGLFLGFSCFLIAAALLLVGLLFRLNIDRRAAEIGLLFAVGYRRWTVRWLLLGEGAVIAAAGAAVGCVAALAYSALLVQFLGAFWPGGALQSFLRPHYTAFSLVVGGASALAVSLLTVFSSVWALGRATPSGLLAGRTTPEGAAARQGPRWRLWVALVALVLALALTAAGWFVPDGENRAMTFFGAGALLLTACLAGAAAWMAGGNRRTVAGHGWWGVALLGVRNAARHRTRSLLTAGLLAAAAFLIVAVEAFRRQAEPGGGFALVAESDLPVYQDLDGDEGRKEIRSRLEEVYQRTLAPAEVARRVDADLDLLKESHVYAFRVHEGDDASCLNLYEPRRPRLLGVPGGLIDREPADPWKLLERPGEPYAAVGEQNTVVWVLKKGVGETLTATAADGSDVKLRIDGLLQDSAFQSGLLLSEENFLTLYPAQEGYNFFLIAAPPGREEDVRAVLNTALADRGFEAVPTAQRVQAYLAVENTYLSTFQALGGLGLVLGSLGLAVVLLRGVWERRGELALLRSLGFRRSTLGWLVLAENGFLLLLGLAAGAVSALVAALPHLVRHGGETPWLRLAGLLAATAAVGLAVGAAAAWAALRAPLVPALRRE